MKEITTNSEKETYDLAFKFAREIKGGELVKLKGDLGAGKTVFVKGFCAGFGYEKNVQSPTFVIMKIYPLKNHKYIEQICHVDAYRLTKETDLAEIGLREYLNDNQTVTLLEWPENLPEICKEKNIEVKIKIESEMKRKLIISGISF